MDRKVMKIIIILMFLFNGFLSFSETENLGSIDVLRTGYNSEVIYPITGIPNRVYEVKAAVKRKGDANLGEYVTIFRADESEGYVTYDLADNNIETFKNELRTTSGDDEYFEERKTVSFNDLVMVEAGEVGAEGTLLADVDINIGKIVEVVEYENQDTGDESFKLMTVPVISFDSICRVRAFENYDLNTMQNLDYYNGTSINNSGYTEYIINTENIASVNDQQYIEMKYYYKSYSGSEREREKNVYLSAKLDTFMVDEYKLSALVESGELNLGVGIPGETVGKGKDNLKYSSGKLDISGNEYAVLDIWYTAAEQARVGSMMTPNEDIEIELVNYTGEGEVPSLTVKLTSTANLRMLNEYNLQLEDGITRYDDYYPDGTPVAVDGIQENNHPVCTYTDFLIDGTCEIPDDAIPGRYEGKFYVNIKYHNPFE